MKSIVNLPSLEFESAAGSRKDLVNLKNIAVDQVQLDFARLQTDLFFAAKPKGFDKYSLSTILGWSTILLAVGGSQTGTRNTHSRTVG